MKILRNAWLFGSVLFLAAWPVAAQMGMGARTPDWRGIFNPVVGSGAAYDMESKGGAKRPIEITVVGKEDVNGKPGYWIEMGLSDPQMGGQMWMKYLFSVDGKNGVASHTVMQMPGRPAMEFDGANTMIRGDQKTSTDVRDQAELVGTESVTTPAGTFSCDHYRAKDGSWDAWVSAKVTPWGLVKSTGNNNTMTLNHIITDAKDRITGTPQKFDPSQIMRGRMGQQPPQ